MSGFESYNLGLLMALRNFSQYTPAPEPMLFSWRRGLLRIWLLISAGWVMGWTIYLVMYSLQGGYSGNRDFVAIPILLLAPPVALLIFGFTTGWALRGFEAEE
jgi:hypothetical protein